MFLIAASIQSQDAPNKIVVQTDSGKYTIDKNIYGHFAEHLGRCIYGGIWVGEDSHIPNINGYRKDIVEALKELEIPVLRWPGGCFADLYHWIDGIGPREERPPMMNVFWGEVVEDNSFGTHEFLDLCELLETQPYIAVNVGSGTPQEAYDWVEYVTSDDNTPMANLRRKNGREKPWKVKYWGIGNENWGCGGNMTASYYADLFKRFSTYCWVDFKIASGSYGDEYDWTETLMKKVGDMPNLMKGLSLHHYTVAHTWENKGSAIDFTKEDWFLTIRKNMEVDGFVKNHLAIMDKYDPENRISLMFDEWGNWHDVEPGTEKDFLFQQNTLRDAVTAAIYLNIFNNYCYRIKMANIAQTINVLQAMVLTKDDKLIKTPTFYVFKMYKVHFDALMLPIKVQSEDYTDGEYHVPSLSVSASKNKSGEINITVANVTLDKDLQTTITLEDLEEFDVKKSDIIMADKMNSFNDFGKDEEVNISKFDGIEKDGNTLNIDIPSKSVMLITLK
jgi:alpha-N-arabinofuranosidase